MNKLVVILAIAVVCGSLSHAQQVLPDVTQPGKSFPFEQLGAEAQKQYSGDGISITPTASGARLRAVMQDVEGEVTPEGLWLTSTADEDVGTQIGFERGRSSLTKQPVPIDYTGESGKVFLLGQP